MLPLKSFLLIAPVSLMLQVGGCPDEPPPEVDGVEVGYVADMPEACGFCHDTSGVAVVVDERTIQIDNFTYDGADVDVYVYVGTTGVNLKDYGFRISEELKEPYNGESVQFTLPADVTLDDFDYVAVYCYRYDEVFAGGTFFPVAP